MILHCGWSRLALPMASKFSVLQRGNLFNCEHFSENSSIRRSLATLKKRTQYRYPFDEGRLGLAGTLQSLLRSCRDRAAAAVLCFAELRNAMVFAASDAASHRGSNLVQTRPPRLRKLQATGICSILSVYVSKTAHYFPCRLALIIATMVRSLRSSFYKSFDLALGALSSLP